MTYFAFALGGILSGPAWLALFSLLTTAKRADEQADEAYREEMRLRSAQAQARDHEEVLGFQGMARWE